MGNSRAYPVFRTTSAEEAWTQALRLNALLEERDDEVILMAELLTVEDAQRMAAALPGAGFDYAGARMDPATGDFLDFVLDIGTVEHSALEAELPLSVLHYVAPGTVERAFVEAVGRGIASVGLRGRWPDDPETDSYGVSKYDGVEVLFNCDDVNWLQRTDHHTLFVHVGKWGDLPRAKGLAEYLGSTVLGEAQRGW
ncbi:hypothetical protein [Streptomyces sp. Ncost-T10-10d]|uniref:hypothetical protein n=1 Tax=Streptomyces sp. Ncost-T10-10d TaxID=1839774 RepID=UPI00081D9B69|nr:hypothetical protein [Streptomyces sp. Ncost-T10-10d]SCF64878.1 hypothetical protein GA0115254_10932 [Streptomyces sp. Ncost-T10-10d]